MNGFKRVFGALLLAGTMLVAAAPAQAGVLAPSAQGCDDAASARVFLP